MGWTSFSSSQFKIHSDGTVSDIRLAKPTGLQPNTAEEVVLQSIRKVGKPSSATVTSDRTEFKFHNKKPISADFFFIFASCFSVGQAVFDLVFSRGDAMTTTSKESIHPDLKRNHFAMLNSAVLALFTLSATHGIRWLSIITSRATLSQYDNYRLYPK